MPVKSRNGIEVSSDNVFSDLELLHADELDTKMRLAAAINRLLDGRRLMQAAAAAKLNTNQPEVSALKHYKLDRFSVERLMKFLTALARDVEIRIREPKRHDWPGRILVQAEAASEEAALSSGASQPLGPRWFRVAGGIAPLSLVELSDRYLSYADREELAHLKARGPGVREIVRRMRRSQSTVSRELQRNAATRGGALSSRATVAQWQAEHAAERPKAAKLAENARLCAYVQERLAGAATDGRNSSIPSPDVPSYRSEVRANRPTQ